MINLLLPMAGTENPDLYESSNYPSFFQDVNGLPMIEKVLLNLYEKFGTSSDVKSIFVIRKEHSELYNFNSILKMIAGQKASVVEQIGNAQGAVCSMLLAIDEIDQGSPLVVANPNQIIDFDLKGAINYFVEQNADAGLITFSSVHPKYSYARFDANGCLEETSEKRPISRSAIAGLYFFANGKMFIEAAMRAILKDRHLEGIFYTSLIFNELVLAGRRVLNYEIKTSEFHSLYSSEKIHEYVNSLQKGSKK